MINNFSDFCSALYNCGFSMGGGNAKGIFALIPNNWNEQGTIESLVKWHTTDPETDPWEWRMRVLEEREDIAYSKVFFRASGYITKEWYPYFYAVRRKGLSFEQEYGDGTLSNMAKRIYEIIFSNGEAALHEMKQLGGFTKEENSAFERAIIELQMRMFITMSGSKQKTNRFGEGYGWYSTIFTTVEDFWSKRNFELESLDYDFSYKKIKEQVLKLYPDANSKKIDKFIKG